MKRLPLSVSTLVTIRQEDMAYIEKTEKAWHLVKHVLINSGLVAKSPTRLSWRGNVPKLS